MSSNVVLANNFDTKKLSFSQLKVLDNGGKQAYMNYDGGMFVFQTPTCTLPYGMSAFDKAGPIKYDAQLSLRGYDEAGSKMQQFYQALSTLDEWMIEQGVKNSKQWFKSDLSRDVIKAFYTPVIRVSKDKDGNPKPYPPTIKCALKQKRDSQEFDVTCYNEKREQYRGIPLEELLVKGTQGVFLIQCTGMWFAGSKYGLSWKIVQTLISKLPQSARNFTFVDDGELGAPSSKAQEHEDEEEEEDEEDEAEEFKAPPAKSVVSAVLPKAAPPAPVATVDDDADDAEPIPVPKPKTTKVVTKSKVVSKAK